MIFNFIKYLNPGWQFNLLPHSQFFPSYYTTDYKNVILDRRYDTLSAQLADAGYMLWNQGFLTQSSQASISYLNTLTKPTLKDEYVFIKKYGGIVWATYALVIRLLELNNPIKEVKNYIFTRKVQKVNIFKEPLRYEDYNTFPSKLISNNPLVSIIIPTLNRYGFLKEVLHDLEKQTYKNIEVIIIDQSDNFNSSFYKNFDLNIVLLQQREKELWTARNKAITTSKSEYLLFFDDDSRIEQNWVEEHLKCLDFFDADISAGVSKSVIGGKVPENYNFFRWADQFDSGNALIKRGVFEKIGLFDEQFNGMRMGDGEFGIRAYLEGFKSISNYKASRVHLKAETGGLRDMSGWDGFRTKRMFDPKPIPSVLYLYFKYFPTTLAYHAILKGILLSNVPYKYKSSSKLLAVSILLSIIKAPILCIQYKRSKSIARKMLQQNGISTLSKKDIKRAFLN